MPTTNLCLPQIQAYVVRCRLEGELIQFPVIRRVEVREYELFQNESSQGISHAFRRGVHAVVGINGLGKTTLLTMLYRALLGPFDQSKSDDVGLLGSQHELSAWRNKGYFRERVSDGAKKATIEADVEFGRKTLTIRRRLNNLQIEHLAVDGTTLESSDEAYQDAVIGLAGTATFFDFFAILRYLVFFLEDRAELIWDRRSQYDMLRILLFDTAAAKAAAEAYDQAQAADSRFRNRRAIVGKDRERLTAAEAAAGDAQASNFRALQTAVAEAEEKDREQAAKIEEVRESIDEAKLRREKSQLDLQEARTALEYEEQAHYKQLFPDIGDTAQYVFLNLLSGGGCLVCGSTGDDVGDYLRAKLESHHCPICNSPSTRHENVTAPADFSRARLRRLKTKVDQLRDAVNTAIGDIEKVEKEYEQLVERREEERVQLRALRSQLRQFGFAELPSDEEIENLRSAVKEGERELGRLLAERTAAENLYGRVVKKQRSVWWREQCEFRWRTISNQLTSVATQKSIAALGATSEAADILYRPFRSLLKCTIHRRRQILSFLPTRAVTSSFPTDHNITELDRYRSKENAKQSLMSRVSQRLDCLPVAEQSPRDATIEYPAPFNARLHKGRRCAS